jgi:hypothetical protein
MGFSCLVPLTYMDENSKVKYPYGVLPSHFLEDVHDVLQVYVNSNSPSLAENREEIQVVAEFITLAMSHRELVSNPHLRVKGIETMALLVPHKMNPRQKDPNLHYIFRGSSVIE